MDTERFRADIINLKTFSISKVQHYNDGSLTLNIKEDVFADRPSHQIICTAVLGFHDTGLVNHEVTYFDINPFLGFKNIMYARQIGINPEEYIELVFMNTLAEVKSELIIACREAIIKAF